MNPALHALLASGALNRPILDSAAPAPAPKRLRTPPADVVERFNGAVQAASLIEEWLGTQAGDLEGSETPAIRLVALFAGGANEALGLDDDGLSAEELELVDALIEAGSAFAVDAGAEPETFAAVFGADDAAAEAAAERLFDLLAERLPEPGSDEFSELIDRFATAWAQSGAELVLDSVYRPVHTPVALVGAFVQRQIQRALPGDRERLATAAQESAMLDAVVRRRKVAIREGRKTIVRERVAGVVRLTPAQRVAIRKARLKAHSATARARRMRSLRVAKAAGLQ
ncbi:hypothetical protein IP84_00715 [beta proteobacterium AAP99]|nr:hypothetical protein IP84_00715 [beta proteobacterium AAP99]